MEYKGITLTLDMKTEEFNSAIKRVRQTTNEFDDDIKKLKQNLKFDSSNVQQYTTLVDRLKSKYSETSKAIEFLKKVLDESLQTGKIQEYDKEWVFLTNQIITLEKNLEITDRNIKDVIGDWQKNGKIGKETLEGLNKPLEEQKTIWDRLNDRTDVFFGNLKANLVSNAISTGLNLLKSGIEAIWSGIKKLASAYTDLMKQGIEYNSLIQGYETSLKTFLGDEGVVNNVISNMQKLGAEVGFELDTLLEGIQGLVIAGVDVDEAQKAVEGFARALSVSGKGTPELKRILANLTQIKTMASATATDLREFGRAGIPFDNLLIQYVDHIEEGFEATQVKFEDIVLAIDSATHDINNSLSKSEELAGKTFNSQINIMQAQWQQLLGAMAEDTTSTLTTEVFPAVNEFLDALLKAFRGDDGGEGGMSAVIQAFSDNITTMINKISESGVIEQFLSGATQIAEAIRSAFDESTPEGKANADALRSAVEAFLDIILDWITDNIGLFIDAGKEIGEAISLGANRSFNKKMSDLLGSWGIDFSGGLPTGYVGGSFGGFMQSGGFGALQSGGFSSGGNTITLNASFVANGNLDEAQALRFADIISERVNEQLGQMI